MRCDGGALEPLSPRLSMLTLVTLLLLQSPTSLPAHWTSLPRPVVLGGSLCEEYLQLVGTEEECRTVMEEECETRDTRQCVTQYVKVYFIPLPPHLILRSSEELP